MKKTLFKVRSLLFSILTGASLFLSLGAGWVAWSFPAPPPERPGHFPAPTLQRPHRTHQSDASAAVFLPVAANALSLWGGRRRGALRTCLLFFGKGQRDRRVPATHGPLGGPPQGLDARPHSGMQRPGLRGFGNADALHLSPAFSFPGPHPQSLARSPRAPVLRSTHTRIPRPHPSPTHLLPSQVDPLLDPRVGCAGPCPRLAHVPPCRD